MYEKYIKRFLDVMLSLVAIIILLPVYAIIAFMVLVTMGRPILFSQERIGKNEKVFKLYKFRSMTNQKDQDGNYLSEEQRITKFGSALRSSSLDELPELFCILKGDMSIVGPRPLPVYYNDFFLNDERNRHKVRGGLLPPDSLSKKAFTEWEEQFEYEIYYANHISFVLDLKVIFTTVGILFQRIKGNYGSEFRPHLNVYRANQK